MLTSAGAGEPISERSVLTIVDAWACIRALSQTAMTLPLLTYRHTDDGGEAVSAPLLERPAPTLTQPELVASAVMSEAIWGETILGKYRDADDRIAQLGVLDPGRIQMGIDAQGEPEYRYTHPFTGGIDVLSARDVVHAKLLTPLTAGPGRGISPVRMCRESLGLSRALSTYASEAAAAGYRPDGVVSVQAGPGGEDTATNLQKGWEDRHSKPRRTAFVTGDVSYVPVGMPPEDAQFLQQRQLSTQEVCRIWGVPAWMVNATVADSLTYANSETQALAMVKFALAPYLVSLESAITADGELLPRGDTFCAFDYTQLLRGDSAARAAYYTQALGSTSTGAPGWMSREEVREAENLPPEVEQPPAPSLNGHANGNGAAVMN
jgi:HK97 family phage portal protein